MSGIVGAAPGERGTGRRVAQNHSGPLGGSLSTSPAPIPCPPVNPRPGDTPGGRVGEGLGPASPALTQLLAFRSAGAFLVSSLSSGGPSPRAQSALGSLLVCLGDRTAGPRPAGGLLTRGEWRRGSCCDPAWSPGPDKGSHQGRRVGGRGQSPHSHCGAPGGHGGDRTLLPAAPLVLMKPGHPHQVSPVPGSPPSPPLVPPAESRHALLSTLVTSAAPQVLSRGHSAPSPATCAPETRPCPQLRVMTRYTERGASFVQLVTRTKLAPWVHSTQSAPHCPRGRLSMGVTAVTPPPLPYDTCLQGEQKTRLPGEAGGHPGFVPSRSQGPAQRGSPTACAPHPGWARRDAQVAVRQNPVSIRGLLSGYSEHPSEGEAPRSVGRKTRRPLGGGWIRRHRPVNVGGDDYPVGDKGETELTGEETQPNVPSHRETTAKMRGALGKQPAPGWGRCEGQAVRSRPAGTWLLRPGEEGLVGDTGPKGRASPGSPPLHAEASSGLNASGSARQKCASASLTNPGGTVRVPRGGCHRLWFICVRGHGDTGTPGCEQEGQPSAEGAAGGRQSSRPGPARVCPEGAGAGGPAPPARPAAPLRAAFLSSKRAVNAGSCFPTEGTGRCCGKGACWGGAS